MNFEQLSGCEVEVIGNILDNAGLLLESEGQHEELEITYRNA